MPKFKEELARMLWLQHEGKISDDEPCRVVLPRIEAKQNAKNPKGKTRFVVDTDSEDMYSRFVMQKNRWIELVGNKSVALDLMCKRWEEPPDEVIRRLAEGE